jgi:hypothetical protein
MRLNKWIAIGFLSVGAFLAGAGSVRAAGIPVSDLDGNWTGTYTNLLPETIVTTAGTENFPTTSKSNNSLNITFSPSSAFAFAMQFTASASTGTTGWFPMTQTAGTFDGTNLAWMTDQYETLSNGQKLDITQMQFNATVQLTGTDTAEMGGSWTMTPLVTSLPSDATANVIIVSGDFDLTHSVTSVVPLPPAAKSALAMLGGLAVLQFIRARRRLALNA